MKKLILMFFIIILNCKFNNPLYPKAEIIVWCEPQVVTLVYEIKQTPMGTEITLTYPKLLISFREIYGGTYGIIDSLRVDYYYPGIDPVRDSIVETLPTYARGFSFYVPSNNQVTTEFDLVTDEVEDLFNPLKGDFKGPINAFLTFYGKDGNEHNFKLFLTVTLQKVIPN
ncbi:MAG: hypothetical protein ABIN20_00260 [candidate division WOR-3 bacterium]